MTYKKAKEIVDTDDVSIEEYAEALAVIQAKEAKLNKVKNPKASQKAHQAWLLRNKEQTELKNDLKKYWPKSS